MMLVRADEVVAALAESTGLGRTRIQGVRRSLSKAGLLSQSTKGGTVSLCLGPGDAAMILLTLLGSEKSGHAVQAAKALAGLSFLSLTLAIQGQHFTDTVHRPAFVAAMPTFGAAVERLIHEAAIDQGDDAGEISRVLAVGDPTTLALAMIEISYPGGQRHIVSYGTSATAHQHAPDLGFGRGGGYCGGGVFHKLGDLFGPGPFDPVHMAQARAHGCVASA